MIQRDLAERSEKLNKLQKTIEDLGLDNMSPEEISALLARSGGGGGGGAKRSTRKKGR
jgi:hypothetical protein